MTVVLVAAIMSLAPRVSPRVPGSLVAIVVVTILASLAHLWRTSAAFRVPWPSGRRSTFAAAVSALVHSTLAVGPKAHAYSLVFVSVSMYLQRHHTAARP